MKGCILRLQTAERQGTVQTLLTCSTEGGAVPRPPRADASPACQVLVRSYIINFVPQADSADQWAAQPSQAAPVAAHAASAAPLWASSSISSASWRQSMHPASSFGPRPCTHSWKSASSVRQCVYAWRWARAAATRTSEKQRASFIFLIYFGPVL